LANSDINHGLQQIGLNMPKVNNKTSKIELSHSMVHYLLTIHKLKEERGYARVTDIAKDLKLTKGSVSTALNNLKKKGFVQEEDDSKFLLLTEKGHDEVHHILSSRTLLFYFLRDFVGVDPNVAEKDACLMEHLMSPETNIKFFQFMKDLACSCDRLRKVSDLPESLKFSTSLDICNYETVEAFAEDQKGDTHLAEND
jgi:DtxR family transcriptional regulator, Mn-dependent transcriptional regulator